MSLYKVSDRAHFFSLLTCGAVFLQILLGVVTRLTGSGLACPDWPLCYGLWFPTANALASIPEVDYSFGQVMLEWGHRCNAVILVAPLVLYVFILTLRDKQSAPILWKIGGAALVTLALQSAVGGLTVFDRNSPWSVATHLSLALFLLALVVSLTRLKGLSVGESSNIKITQFSAISAVLAVLVLVTIISGAVVAKSWAALACSGWPLCNGELIPSFLEKDVALHMSHRFLALVTVLSLFGFSYKIRELRFIYPLIVLQILIGALVLVIYAGDSLLFQVLLGMVHQTFAVIIFTVLVWLFWSPTVHHAGK